MKAGALFAAAIALCVGVFATPIAAMAAAWQGEMLPDAVVSWWSRPNATYQPFHGITYITGVSAAGDWVWGAYDHKTGITTRKVLGRSRRDDHNTPAIIAPVDKPPIVFYTGHNASTVIWYRISAKIGDWLPGAERAIQFPGKVTYVQAYRGSTPETLLLLTRCNSDWMLALSTDYGTSWSVRPLVDFDADAYGYLTTTQLADGTIRVSAAGHPAQTNLTSIYYTEIDPAGDIRSAEGTILANVYTGAGLPISAPKDLTPIYEFPAEKRGRLLDVSAAPNPEVVFAEWVGEEEAEYVYLTKTPEGWRPTTLVRTGRPIGYDYATRYLGGATFPNPTSGGDLYLSREITGYWQVQRWTKTASDWAVTPITSSLHILARPSIPFGASPQLPLLWLDLTSYADYTTFSGSTWGLLPEGRVAPRTVGTAVTGDWDGDGRTEPGVFNAGVWTLRVNSQKVKVRFGRLGDRPLVGDWDGDGKDGIGFRRGREWVLSNTIAPTKVYRRFVWGAADGRPVVGDWDGNRTDGIGVRRGTTWYLKNKASAGPTRYKFSFGRATDVPLVGDWNGDRKDTVGVKRGQGWMLRNRLLSGSATLRFNFGDSTDVPVVGDWGALGKDTPGVRRGSTGVWYLIDTQPGLPRADFAPNRMLF